MLVTVIEPRLSLQWFVKVEPLARAAGDAVRSCKEGVHGNFDGDPFALIHATRTITEHVRRLT